MPDQTNHSRSSNIAPGQIAPLTGLRIVAALGVYATHFWSRTEIGSWGALDFARAPMTRLMTRGFVGVPLFFMLSGFVLTYSTSAAIPNSPTRRKVFWINRFARIYPAYVVSLLLATPVLRANILHYVDKFGPTKGHLFSGVAALLVMTLTQSWVPRAANFWNGPAWSLSVEAFFYTLFPYIICSRMVRASSRWRTPTVVGVLSLIGLVAPIVGQLVAGGPLGDVGRAFVLYFPALNLPTFLIGIALGRAYLGRVPAPERGNLGNWLANGSIVGLLAILAWLPRAPSELLDYALQPLFALLIFGLATGRGWVARFLSVKWMVFLGEASYSFYLLHEVVTLLVGRVLGARISLAADEGGRLTAWQAIVCLGACLVVSSFVYSFVERPARLFIRNRLARNLKPEPSGQITS
jgi:peptidoglycan/LPS O-acetylase OafA/YrhL